MKTPFTTIIFWFSRHRRRFGAGFGFLLLFMPTLVLAQFNYTIETNLTVTITGYTGPGGAVTIPETINGLPVTGITNQAFNYSSVTSVTIGNNVTYVGDYAFNTCLSLTNLWIGSGLASLGVRVFSLCNALQAVSVDVNNQHYSSTNGVLFDKSQTTIVQYPFGKTGNYIIPNSVNAIAASAFESCGGLTGLTLDDSLTTIGYSSFASTALTNVTIPDSVTSIDMGAFFHCTSLASVTIGNGVTNLGQSSFGSCTSLTKLTLGNSVANIGPSAFNGCSSLTNFTIPNSVTSIGDNAFSGCGRLTAILIPNSVTNIGSAFSGCTSLTSLTLGNSVTKIGPSAFNGCSSLTNFTIPNSVMSIGTSAFAGCGSLTSITMPNSVTSIDVFAFANCTSLTNVTIGSGDTYIGYQAFLRCSNLGAVYFLGDAPITGFGLFDGDSGVIVYYLPGKTGWTSPFAGRPTLPISMQIQTGDSSFGVRSNQFGFNVTGSYGLTAVVEAATNLAKPTWYPLQTNTLNGSSVYFSDPQWMKYPNRFYRVRWP